MRKLLFAGFIPILLIVSATAMPRLQDSADQPKLETVASVDLKRYIGAWYEIARYENKFEKKCVGNVTANYTLKDDGKIKVLNRCLKKDGTINDAEGEARVKDKATNAKLEVRFAPGFLSFLPQVWGDYWIIDLASDYSYAVVGSPKRDYLWILSRTPQMSEPLYQDILHKIEQKGFNPGKIIKTPQKVETVKGTVVNN